MSLTRLSRSVKGDVKVGDVLTVTQAAHALNISTATLWRWCNQGRLRPTRVLGRTVFLRHEIAAVKQRQHAAG